MKNQIILTPKQKTIISLNKGHHIVYAPAGSGKTEMLSLRVKKALENGVNPEEMICLTFTNKAALNMKKRIGEMNDFFVGNNHAFGSKFLFSNNLIPKQTNILDEAEARILIREANDEVLFLDPNSPYIQSENEMRSLELFVCWQNQKKLKLSNKIIDKTQELFEINFDSNSSPLDLKNKLEDIYEKYEKLKGDLLAIDFDDILNLTLYYLQKSNTFRDKYSWVQVDEFQDLNTIQWSILQNLVHNKCHIVLFGDREQAIYSFLGADNISQSKIVKDYQQHSIYENHRSPQYLLDLYNDYTERNLDPIWKEKPFSNIVLPKKDNLIFEFVQGDQYLEARKVIEKFVLPYVDEFQEPIAILMSTNNQVDQMSRMCTEYAIKHFPVSSFDLFQRKIIKDLMAFFHCVTGSKDKLDWIRIFALFSGSSLKVSRKIINGMFMAGLHPTDLIFDKQNDIDKFHEIISKQRIVVFDTETTGLDTENDDIIQLAATEVICGKTGHSLNVFIKTDKALDKTIDIHKITPEILKEKGISAKEGLSLFFEFIQDDHLLAHNASFDVSILKCYSNRNRFVFNSKSVILDSVELTKRLFPALKSYKLGEIITELNLEGNATHNAVEDVLATVSVVKKLYQENERIIPDRYSFLQSNHKHIEKFKKIIIPIWSDINSKLYLEYHINKLIDDFIVFNNKPVKDSENNAIKKLKRFMEKEWQAGISLNDFLIEKLPIYSKLKESDLIIGDESVVISTIHRAKGLEWDTVIIPSCTDDKYPSYYSKLDAIQNPEKKTEIIREQARLLYVALTRTKKKLILTQNSQFKSQYGKLYPQKISRFIQPVLKHFKHN